MGAGRQYYGYMLKSAMRVLVAFIVVFAMAVPAGARAMPMSGDINMMGNAVDQPCQNCPQPDQPGGMTPDKMPACLALACINVPAMLPSPVLAPVRIALRAEYVWPTATRLAGADPAPDPFPPRPIVLL
jgi:hypothetical protein